jgi:hypothetical protein
MTPFQISKVSCDNMLPSSYYEMDYDESDLVFEELLDDISDESRNN